MEAHNCGELENPKRARPITILIGTKKRIVENKVQKTTTRCYLETKEMHGRIIHLENPYKLCSNKTTIISRGY